MTRGFDRSNRISEDERQPKSAGATDFEAAIRASDQPRRCRDCQRVVRRFATIRAVVAFTVGEDDRAGRSQEGVRLNDTNLVIRGEVGRPRGRRRDRRRVAPAVRERRHRRAMRRGRRRRRRRAVAIDELGARVRRRRRERRRWALVLGVRHRERGSGGDRRHRDGRKGSEETRRK